jgi:putative transcriptional regulator
MGVLVMLRKRDVVNKFPVIGIAIIAVLLSAYFALSNTRTDASPGNVVRSSYMNPEALPPSGELRGDGPEGLTVGKFLVANKKLTDPHFARTIVLLLSYGYRGAVGLIVNRPTDAKLNHVLPNVKSLQKSTDKLFFGGPVNVNQITMIIQSSIKPEKSGKIFDHIYVSNSLGLLEQMIENKKPDQRYHLYAGYAGWGPGQLESEIARNDWRIIKGNPDIIFNNTPDQIWQKLVPQNMTI